jgi:hypothetical protein
LLPIREKVRILPKKMAPLARVAPNPPKEEGGGGLLHPEPIMHARMLRSNESGSRFASVIQGIDLEQYS